MATLDIQANTSTMPLASRLDHLDFVMKYLEGKQDHLSRFPQNSSGSSSVQGQGQGQGQKQFVTMPMDVAAKETCFKGPLTDRVASLEHRLVQLCLAMDSSNSSTTDAFSAQESQRKIVEQQVLEGPGNQENSGKQKLKRQSYHIQFGKKNGSQLDNKKKCKKSQKKGLRSWPRLKFLDC